MRWQFGQRIRRLGQKKAGLQRTSLYYLPNIGDRSLLQPGIPFARRLGTIR